MKKSFFCTVLLSLLSLQLWAQDKKPMVMIGNAADGGTTTKQQLLAKPSLVDVNGLYTITEFTVCFLINNGHTLYGPYATKGNTLTKEQRDRMATLKPPITVRFDDMKAAKTATGKIQPWSLIILKVEQ